MLKEHLHVLKWLPELNYFGRYPKLSLFFWGLNILFVLLAILVHTAKAELIISLLSYESSPSVTPQNICVILSDRILDISNTPFDQKHKLETKLTALYVYNDNILTKSTKSNTLHTDLIQDLKILNKVLHQRKNEKSTTRNSPELVARLISIRAKLQYSMLHMPNEYATWYIDLAQVSCGYIEGLSSPFILTYRAFMATLNNNLSFRAITDPPSWKRTGCFFNIALLYSSLLSIYLFSLIAHKSQKSLLYIPGLLSLLYGMGHFLVFLYKISGSIPSNMFP